MPHKHLKHPPAQPLPSQLSEDARSVRQQFVDAYVQSKEPFLFFIVCPAEKPAPSTGGDSETPCATNESSEVCAESGKSGRDGDLTQNRRLSENAAPDSTGVKDEKLDSVLSVSSGEFYKDRLHRDFLDEDSGSCGVSQKQKGCSYFVPRRSCKVAKVDKAVQVYRRVTAVSLTKYNKKWKIGFEEMMKVL